MNGSLALDYQEPGKRKGLGESGNIIWNFMEGIFKDS